MRPLRRVILSLRDPATRYDVKRRFQLRAWPTRRIEVTGDVAGTSRAGRHRASRPAAHPQTVATESQFVHEMIDWIVEFSHGQFALRDAGDVSDFDLTDSDLSNRAAVNEDCTGISIFSPRFGRFAHLEIEVVEAMPSFDTEKWDHVVELNLLTLSGEMEISTIPGSDMIYDPVSREHTRGTFSIEPGIYQLYVLFANLASMDTQLSEASDSEYHSLFYGPSDDENGVALPDLETLKNFDCYRVVMWPLRDRVIKRFNGSS